VVVVPYIQKTGLMLNRVLVCWDGGRQAARAIADALPFLHRAKAIEVVIVATEPLKRDARCRTPTSLVIWLAMISTLILSGLSPRKPTWQTPFFPTPRMSRRISSSCAGYGHSRLREFVLGGVTRELLSSMTIPTLMAH
jgi:hypothetical protein